MRPDSFIRHLSRQPKSVVVGAALAALLAASWILWPHAKPSAKMSVASANVPVVMHTSGGLLEVATIEVTESFRFEAAPKTFLGLDLGQTVSHVQVRVIYRFHIEMAKEWPIRFKDSSAVVEAGEIKPTLPVAFDTETMVKETSSGWGRFDKHQNLAELELRMTPELEKRAAGFRTLAVDSARRSVGDFVRTWLIKERHWQRGSAQSVQVCFPGETLPSGMTSQPTDQLH